MNGKATSLLEAGMWHVQAPEEACLIPQGCQHPYSSILAHSFITKAVEKQRRKRCAAMAAEQLP